MKMLHAAAVGCVAFMLSKGGFGNFILPRETYELQNLRNSFFFSHQTILLKHIYFPGFTAASVMSWI